MLLVHFRFTKLAFEHCCINITYYKVGKKQFLSCNFAIDKMKLELEPHFLLTGNKEIDILRKLVELWNNVTLINEWCSEDGGKIISVCRRMEWHWRWTLTFSLWCSLHLTWREKMKCAVGAGTCVGGTSDLGDNVSSWDLSSQRFMLRNTYSYV